MGNDSIDGITKNHEALPEWGFHKILRSEGARVVGEISRAPERQLRLAQIDGQAYIKNGIVYARFKGETMMVPKDGPQDDVYIVYESTK